MIAPVDERRAEPERSQEPEAQAHDESEAGERRDADDAPEQTSREAGAEDASQGRVAFCDPLFAPSARSQARARAPARDPLAHRRGEPRVLAFFWAMYLLASAGVTVFSVREYGVLDASTFKPAVQSLFVMAALGVCALWPMVRLSQTSPRSPVGAALADVLVVLIPVQGVLWPMVWLGQWPWEIGWGLAAMFTAWTCLVGALIALGATASSRASRLGLMALTLLITAGAPTAMAAGALLGRHLPEGALLASAYTAIFALTWAPSGLSPRMSTGEWIAVWAPLAVAAPIWILAAALSGGAKREKRQPG